MDFVDKFVIKVLPLSFFDINASKKLICFWEYFMVNFIDGWKLYANPKNSFKFSYPLVYTQKISSKYRN